MDVLGDGPQLVGSVRRPATTDDRVAASREGLGQLETEAPVGAGDHDRVHQRVSRAPEVRVPLDDEVTVHRPELSS